MIIEKSAKEFCCEDISKIYGYAEAVADKENVWSCHHCLGLVWSREQLIEMGLYYNQPADRLMFVTKSEHAKLHYITRNPSPKGIKHKKHKVSPNVQKSVIQYTKDGVFVAEYPSLIEAQRQTGFDDGYIGACCNGKCKYAYGYIWTHKTIKDK